MQDLLSQDTTVFKSNVSQSMVQSICPSQDNNYHQSFKRHIILVLLDPDSNSSLVSKFNLADKFKIYRTENN